MRRAPAYLLPLLLALPALPLGLISGPAEAKKVRVVKERKPVAQPRRKPPARDEAEAIGNGGVIPPGPEADGGSKDTGPVVKATATVWAQAGSRSWSGCSTVAGEAAKQLFSLDENINHFGADHLWSTKARECPNVPEVLAMAARVELLRQLALPEGIDEDTDLSLLESALAESRDQALAWIDDAQAELFRRRDRRDYGLEYWRGRALLSTGDYPGARTAFRRAERTASIEGWKLRRLMALTELYAGELDTALELAARSLIDAPQSDRLMSEYVLALVLDRAGDPAGAQRRMIQALNRDGDRNQMRTLEAAMPIHERLYMRAYARTARKDSTSALRLWAAYLARPEPEAPERRLAERHQSALKPLPRNLGGPAKPGEAPEG